MKTFNNLHNLHLYFTSEKKCIEYLEGIRWNNEPACLRCGSLNPYVITNHKNKGYRCRDCNYLFNVLIGTIFENTKLPLVKWFKAIYIVTSHKKGISSYQLGKDLGFTQKTAWFVLGRIRKLAEYKVPFMLEGTVQVDETFVGGKESNKHQSFKAKQARKRGDGKLLSGVQGKAPVLGLIQEGGKVVTCPLSSVHKHNMFPLIEKHVKKGSTMVTDDFKIYRRLDTIGYHHESVNHSIGEYARDGFHTNTIEGYWSILKRGIYGIYHQVSKKHLFRYCNEFSFRYNTKDLKEVDRFNVAVKQLENTRLKYSEYIKKV